MAVRSQGSETANEIENEKLNNCCGLLLDLKLMRLKTKIPMNMLRSMSTIER